MVLSFVLVAIGAKAQGLVSLSEEAMFEDELDTVTEAPKTNTENKPTAPTEVRIFVGNQYFDVLFHFSIRSVFLL